VQWPPAMAAAAEEEEAGVPGVGLVDLGLAPFPLSILLLFSRAIWCRILEGKSVEGEGCHAVGFASRFVK
jgi:hypothetical protein